MALAPQQTLVLEGLCADPVATTRRFWAKVDRTGDCWLWTASRMRMGYGRFAVTTSNIWQAHRFSALLSTGEIPAGALVLHRCDNPPCVRPEHLYFGDGSDNNDDMSERNRFNLARLRGSQNARSKLTAEQVLDMRRRYAAGENRTELGRAFGVSRQTASDIIARKLWGWLGMGG